MSTKAECPSCGAYLSGVYDAMTGRQEGCPSCGLPATAIRAVFGARKAHADAELTKKYEAVVMKVAAAESRERKMRDRMEELRDLLARWGEEDDRWPPLTA